MCVVLRKKKQNLDLRRSVITDAMDINMQLSMIKWSGKSGIFLFKKVNEKYNTHLQFDVKEGIYIVVRVKNTKDMREQITPNLDLREDEGIMGYNKIRQKDLFIFV